MKTKSFISVVEQLSSARKQANFKFLINRILSIAHYNDSNPNDFFDVTSKALKGCDPNYHLYKKQLSQVFDIEHSYQAKNGQGYCKKYRLKVPIMLSDFDFMDTKPHSDSIDFDFESQTVEIAMSVLKRLTISTGEKKTSKPLKTIWQANHFLKQYIQLSITPQYITDRINLNEDAKTFEKKNKVFPIKASISSFLETKIAYTQAAAAFILNDIRQGNFFCSVSPTNGRLNTSFTSLASVLTPYLRLDGDPLKGLDIRNSQFLIFAVLLKNCQSKDKMLKFLELNGYMNSELVGKKQDLKTLGELVEILKHIVNQTKKGADFDIFISQCENGIVYDAFAQAAGITRQQAKAAFFHLLFGAGGQTEYSEVFEQIYPSIIRTIKLLKKQIGYKLFSVMLQKIESIYFVKTILLRCYNLNIPILTKHDSVFTTERNFKKMERIFNEVMKKDFNVNLMTCYQ